MKKTGNAVILFLLVIWIFGKVIYFIPDGEIVEKKENVKPTVTLLAGQSTSDAGTIEMIQEVLEVKFPDVNFEWICVGWGSENFNLRVTGKYRTGHSPDIILGKGQDALNYAQGGFLLPLTDECAERLKKEEKDSLRLDRKLYGLPYTCQYQGVLYNKEMFREEGLQVPETREELERLVTELERKEITPFAGHFLQAWPVANMTMQFLINDVFYKNPVWGDTFRNRVDYFSENESVKQCFANNQYILQHSWKDALQLEQYECDERFGRGEAAMYMTGFWSLQNINQNENGFELGIFPYPNETGDARLIKEINLTFMKSVFTEQEELVDQILLELGENVDLSERIADFTKGQSVLTGAEQDNKNGIFASVKEYEDQDRVIAAETGNTQLEWNFQRIVSEQTLKWLCGEIELEAVLQYADKNVADSIMKN